MFSSIIFQQFLLAVLAIIVVAVCFLYIKLFIEKKKNTHLFGQKGLNAENVTQVLNSLKLQLTTVEEKLVTLEKKQAAEEKKAKGYLQKVGFLRFNPFADTGGQQSFILSLLDEDKNGILISNLVGRSGARWIVKKINKGRSDDLKLSEEEKKVMESVK